ncbi:uncharacterized protein METZ01_LOCUS369445, partial [marine metagenome]
MARFWHRSSKELGPSSGNHMRGGRGKEVLWTL